MQILLFAFLVYEFCTQFLVNDDAEAYQALAGVKKNLFYSISLLLMGLLLLSAMLQGAVYFITAAIEGIFSWRLLGYLMKVVLLYVIFPGFLGIVMGLFLMKSARAQAYAFILLFSFLFSPFMTEILPDTFIGINTRIDDWLALFVPLNSASVDGLYGIPVEYSRMTLILMWIFVFLLLFFLPGERRQTRAGKFVLGASATAVVVFAAIFAGRDKWFLMNRTSKWGTFYKDQLFYADWQGEETPAQFEAESYEIRLHIRGNLKAVAAVTLSEALAGQETYPFTLYHGFLVSEIKDEMGNRLSFDQDGDFISVETREGTTVLELTYAGNFAKYYADRQAVLLPAYTAYYPVPGHLDLWDEQNECIRPLSPQTVKHFDVTVDALVPVISNLEEKETGVFCGNAAGFTLYGGFFNQEVTDSFIRYYPGLMDSLGGFPSHKEIEKMIQNLEDRLSLDEHLNWSGKKVFCLPNTISYARGKDEDIVISTDSLFYTDVGLGVAAERIAAALIAERYYLDSEESKELASMLEDYLCTGTVKLVSEGRFPTEEELAPYLFPGKAYSNKEKLTALKAFRQLFLWHISEEGEDIFLPQVYEYLVDPNRSQAPVNYLFQREVNK